jgi:predicted RNase H-like HicB family nuclease
MTYSVTLDRDEDDVWIAECPSIPGCVSQGESRSQALENVRSAIRECLIVRRRLGLCPSLETVLIEVIN